MRASQPSNKSINETPPQSGKLRKPTVAEVGHRQVGVSRGLVGARDARDARDADDH